MLRDLLKIHTWRWLIVAIGVQGCGVAYIAPQVDAGDSHVTLRQLTFETVASANQAAHVPHQIPHAFFQSVGATTALGTIGDLPDVRVPPGPTVLTTRIPDSTDPGPYTIGVGDVLMLATKVGIPSGDGLQAAQHQRQTYTVQDDGAIAVPEVGRVPVTGLTLAEAEGQVFSSFVAARIDPTFSVEIAEFHASQVALGGAVASPMMIPITLTPLYLDEAVTRAGGFSAQNGAETSIRIYRDGSLYQIPLGRYLDDPSLQKIRLVSGDSVYVDTTYELDRAKDYFEQRIVLSQARQQAKAQALAALSAEINIQRATLADQREAFQERVALDAVPRDYVYLTGEVSAPGRFALPFGRTASLADALYAQGGFLSQTGNPAQIYILRADGQGAVTAWQLDARNIANLVVATQVVMQPNDIVFIAEQPVTRWNRVVQQIVPSLITSGAGLATD